MGARLPRAATARGAPRHPSKVTYPHLGWACGGRGLSPHQARRNGRARGACSGLYTLPVPSHRPARSRPPHHTPPAAGTIRFSEESRALLDDDRKPRGRYFTAQRRRTPLWALVLFGVAGTLTLFVVCRFFSAMLGGGHREAAFAMSLGAGMSTGIGAAFVLVTTSLDRRLLAATLSFSAGVMLYVSLVEVIGVADEYFAKGDGVRADVAYFHATLSFFAGVAIMAVVDKLVHLVFVHRPLLLILLHLRLTLRKWVD